MEAEAYDSILFIYGCFSILFAIGCLIELSTLRNRWRGVGDSRWLILGTAIMGVSGLVAITQSSTYYDWLLTVPLIYFALSLRITEEKANREMLGLAFWSVITIIGAITIEGFDYSFEQRAGLITPLAVLFGWFYFQAIRRGVLGSLTFFEQFNFILILAYPILWFSAGMTISDTSHFDGSILDMIGWTFYDYLAIYVVLSVFCKILLSLSHVRLTYQ